MHAHEPDRSLRHLPDRCGDWGPRTVVFAVGGAVGVLVKVCCSCCGASGMIQ